MTDVRREERAARRRTLRLLTEGRIAKIGWMLGQPARSPLAQASISSTARIPTDS